MTNGANRRKALLATVDRYFEAMDRGDVDATVACFADDATLASEGQMYLTGKVEIAAFFQRLTDNSERMAHDVTNLVVDADAGKVAAELHYTNVRVSHAPIDMHNCNFFDIGDDGRFRRVRFWVGDPSQLKAARS